MIKQDKYEILNSFGNPSLNIYSIKSKAESKTKNNFDLYNKFNIDIKNKDKEKLSKNEFERNMVKISSC